MQAAQVQVLIGNATALDIKLLPVSLALLCNHLPACSEGEYSSAIAFAGETLMAL